MELDKIREISLIAASIVAIIKAGYDIAENERKKRQKKKKRPRGRKR